MLGPTSSRAQLLLASVLPSALLVAVVGERGVTWSERALDQAMAERLISVAAAAATSTSDRVLALGPGDGDTRTHRAAEAKLEALRARAGVARILVVRAEDDAVLVDAGGDLPVGATYHRAKLDRRALQMVRTGAPAASVLFDPPGDGPVYKTGYVPLDPATPARAYVAAAAPARYLQSILQLRRRWTEAAVVGLAVVGLVAVLLAARFARPLTRLADAARAIGRGELETTIAIEGPRETRVLARTMRDMASALKTRQEEMQMMLAGIAHEVRNPLGGIELFGGLLAEDLEGDPRRRHVDRILRELGLLSRVVDDFLAFARDRPPERAEADPIEVAEEALALTAPAAEAKAVRLDRPAGDPAPPVAMDRAQVQRALLNLLRNAVDASPPEGAVRLEVEADEATVRWVVEDEGPGVDPELRDRLFTPFFTTKEKGTGLGLAIVQQIARAHGGRVEVASSDRGGARFVLEIPRG